MSPQRDKNVTDASAETHKSRATSLEMIPEPWKEGREQASVRQSPSPGEESLFSSASEEATQDAFERLDVAKEKSELVILLRMSLC